jgi:uncharacterized membrane protein
MAPISELRGSIPLGFFYDLPIWQVLIISIIGNMIPVLIILLSLEFISELKIFKKFFTWLFDLTEKRHSNTFKKYRDFGLVVLTAIPLPFTGAYTASMCAFIFNIPIKRAFPLILTGVIIASIIVTIISLNLI